MLTPRRFVPAIQPQPGGDEGWVILYYRQTFALYDGRILLEPDTARFLGDADGTLFLGHLDGKPCQLIRLREHVELPGLSWQGLRGMIGQVDDDTFRLLGLAQQLDAWHETHRFCGRCGTGMLPRAGERAMECPACGLRQYPKLSPCIIVLISHEDQVLLARAPHFQQGFYSTLAGFIEPGESAEECLHREVQEEVGLQVDQLEYLGSQNWPFPNSLMLGYHARYKSGDIVPQPGEIEDARWWPVDELPRIPPRGTISRWLIDCHLARLRGQNLPPMPA